MKEEHDQMSNVPIIIKTGKKTQSRKTIEDFQFTETCLPKNEDYHLRQYHQSAWEAYKSLPFPSKEDEPWRRTDISKLKTDSFSLFKESAQEKAALKDLDTLIATEEVLSGQVISGAVKNHTTIKGELEEKGVIFTDFHQAEKYHPDILNQTLGKIVSPGEDKFTALAAALASDGVFLYVPKNVVIDNPFTSFYWGAGEDKAFMNHLVIWLEDGARASFLHESASSNSSSNGQLFHNGIVEVHVGRNATLTFVELQNWGQNVWSFTRERARVMAGGRLDWVFGAMGSQLSKNFSDIDLIEPGATGRMSGIYFTSKNQHLDLDTQQKHLSPNTTSDLLFKGALKDESRSVWQGMIYVAPGAVGTDGYQANRNLLLSKASRADSIPGLEILADDVRCTHGATVGKIDENELFYLLSRGIPKHEAEQLIIMGFFNSSIERIPSQDIRRRVKELIKEKMNGNFQN